MAKLKFGSPAWRKKYMKNAGKKKKRKNTGIRKLGTRARGTRVAGGYRRKKRATTKKRVSNPTMLKRAPKGWIRVKRVKIIRNRGQVKILVERARPRKRK